MLIAANWDLRGTTRVFSRDDATSAWTAAIIARDRPTTNFLPQIRSFGRHRDRATGIDRVFAGHDPRGIFSGTCDRINLLGGGRIRTLPQSSGRASEFPQDSPLEESGFELSIPLARMSLDFRGGEWPSGRLEQSKQAIRFHGGPAVRIPFPPPESPLRT